MDLLNMTNRAKSIKGMLGTGLSSHKYSLVRREGGPLPCRTFTNEMYPLPGLIGLLEILQIKHKLLITWLLGLKWFFSMSAS